MTIRRVVEICCERCGQTGELTAAPRSRLGAPTKGGSRNVKPADWGRLSISVKTEPDKPVKVIRSIDLCPACVKATADFLDGAE